MQYNCNDSSYFLRNENAVATFGFMNELTFSIKLAYVALCELEPLLNQSIIFRIEISDEDHHIVIVQIYSPTRIIM